MASHSLAVSSFWSIAQPWASRCSEILDQLYPFTRMSISTALTVCASAAVLMPLPNPITLATVYAVLRPDSL
jgi:hypothetical protein